MLSEHMTEFPSSKGTEDVARFDRRRRLTPSRPLNERSAKLQRRGQYGHRRGIQERPGTEPYPEAPHAHLELRVGCSARPPELGERLPAGRAPDRREATIVKRGLPQLINERTRGNLTQDGKSDRTGSARMAHPDQAVTPLGWFEGPSTQRTGQRFYTRYLSASELEYTASRLIVYLTMRRRGLLV